MIAPTSAAVVLIGDLAACLRDCCQLEPERLARATLAGLLATGLWPNRCGRPGEYGHPCNLPPGHSAPECQSCVWQVTRLVDKKVGWYRLHVEGVILDADSPPVPFSWAVPDLSDPKYDLSHLTP